MDLINLINKLATDVMLVNLLILTLLILVVTFSRGSQRQALKHKFNVTARYRVLGSDMLEDEPALRLKAGKNIGGKPDLLCCSRLSRRRLVCEYKSRQFTNKPTDREIFQVTLYMGMAKRWYQPTPKARILYGCGSLVSVKYSARLYRALISLEDEVRKSKTHWIPVKTTRLLDRNPMDLHKLWQKIPD